MGARFRHRNFPLLKNVLGFGGVRTFGGLKKVLERCWGHRDFPGLKKVLERCWGHRDFPGLKNALGWLG